MTPAEIHSKPLHDDQRTHRGVHQEDQELQRPAQDVPRRADRRLRRRRGRQVRDGRGDRRERAGHARRSGRCDDRDRRHGRGSRREGGSQVADRRMPVDILDRHRRQVVPLANPGAEPRHHHRVRTQVVEEVRVDRHLLHTQHVREHLGERLGDRLGAVGALGGRSRGGGDDGFRGGCQRAGQAADRRVPVDVLDRHRRQVVPLANPGAEPRHHHRVRTQVVEEVRIDRHLLGAQHPRQHLGQCRPPRGPAQERPVGTATVGSGRRRDSVRRQTDCTRRTRTVTGETGSVGGTTTGTRTVTGETGSVGAAFTCWAVAGRGRATVRASTGFATA